MWLSKEVLETLLVPSAIITDGSPSRSNRLQLLATAPPITYDWVHTIGSVTYVHLERMHICLQVDLLSLQCSDSFHDYHRSVITTIMVAKLPPLVSTGTDLKSYVLTGLTEVASASEANTRSPFAAVCSREISSV